MDYKQALDNKIADHNLLNHPFYQAWSAGELPVDALRSYAREYGAFISTLPKVGRHSTMPKPQKKRRSI